MRVVGLSGGLEAIGEDRSFLFPRHVYHDSAAVLVEDGDVVAAVEESDSTGSSTRPKAQ